MDQPRSETASAPVAAAPVAAASRPHQRASPSRPRSEYSQARLAPRYAPADTLWAEQDPKLSLSIGPIPRWHFPLASGLIPRDLAKGRKHVGANPTLNVVHREVKIGSIVHDRALEGLQERVPGAGQSLVQPALNM